MSNHHRRYPNLYNRQDNTVYEDCNRRKQSQSTHIIYEAFYISYIVVSYKPLLDPSPGLVATFTTFIYTYFARYGTTLCSFDYSIWSRTAVLELQILFHAKISEIFALARIPMPIRPRSKTIFATHSVTTIPIMLLEIFLQIQKCTKPDSEGQPFCSSATIIFQPCKGLTIFLFSSSSES